MPFYRHNKDARREEPVKNLSSGRLPFEGQYSSAKLKKKLCTAVGVTTLIAGLVYAHYGKRDVGSVVASASTVSLISFLVGKGYKDYERRLEQRIIAAEVRRSGFWPSAAYQKSHPVQPSDPISPDRENNEELGTITHLFDKANGQNLPRDYYGL